MGILAAMGSAQIVCVNRLMWFKMALMLRLYTIAITNENYPMKIYMHRCYHFNISLFGNLF